MTTNSETKRNRLHGLKTAMRTIKLGLPEIKGSFRFPEPYAQEKMQEFLDSMTVVENELQAVIVHLEGELSGNK